MHVHAICNVVHAAKATLMLAHGHTLTVACYSHPFIFMLEHCTVTPRAMLYLTAAHPTHARMQFSNGYMKGQLECWAAACIHSKE
jgi:hypothetical protein